MVSIQVDEGGCCWLEWRRLPALARPHGCGHWHCCREQRPDRFTLGGEAVPVCLPPTLRRVTACVEQVVTATPPSMR